MAIVVVVVVVVVVAVAAASPCVDDCGLILIARGASIRPNGQPPTLTIRRASEEKVCPTDMAPPTVTSVMATGRNLPTLI